MHHRSFDDIFAMYPHTAPLKDEVRETCLSHMESMRLLEDLYCWIEKEEIPQLREAYAECTWQILDERRVDPNDETFHWLRTYMWDEIYTHLRSIIRQAQSEAFTDRFIENEKMRPVVASSPEEVPQLQVLQNQMEYVLQELARMQQEKVIPPSEALIAMYYTAKATEEDKRNIEYFLRRTCQKHERSMTAQIKQFLRLKQKDGLLQLPVSLKDEWEMVCQFGYDRSLKAYKNNRG